MCRLFHPRARLLALAILSGVLALPGPVPARAASAGTRPANEAALQASIEKLKQSPKGPFDRLRWFCADGTVHPPKPYPCENRGGGVQHGEWNQTTKSLREQGYMVGNVLADLDPDDFIGANPNLSLLEQILLERFLVGWDDGWIFRGARTYRGALQIEDEEAGSRAAVLAMLGDPAWRTPERYFLLRETVRLLPLQSDEGTASTVRREALQIAAKDNAFTPLRAKIHNAPDAGDAERVREYARNKGKKNLAGDYEQLAADIEALYTSSGGGPAARELAPKVGAPLDKTLRELGARLETERDPRLRLGLSSRLLGLIRKHFPKIQDPEVALEALQVSIALEDDAYTAGNQLLTQIEGLSRAKQLELLSWTSEALYGAGFLSVRQLAGVKNTEADLQSAVNPSLNEYREKLRYLARVPEWSSRWIEFNFGPEIARLAPLEPEVLIYPQDRMRGSPLIFYGNVNDDLLLDANRLAGIQHEIFGERIGGGVRALNPGLARGVLGVPDLEKGTESLRSDGIYLLPETVAELPRVSGILTQGEGSSLSHVQLLARNLGIPNVVIGDELLSKVRSRAGSPVVMAVSPNGVVQLDEDGPRWDAVFGEEATTQSDTKLVIRPDLDKLDLSKTDLIPLGSLRAADSGALSGPKGANLGELKHSFGDQVPNGFVIPFGVFRKLLDQPIQPGGPSAWEWMKAQYAAIDAEHDAEKRERLVSDFLTKLRAFIATAEPNPTFRSDMRAMLDQTFGPDGTYGVFVRSDTNVEDLPGFTGAGLNLTVPNLVGYENIMKAVHEVWASPFTERAYGWRQANMENPEYVFPAVVVQQGFPSEKSGVMVTADVDSGEKGWISVAVSEGVGGAVEGQSTESLRINVNSGEVEFLAQATAPTKAVLSPSGGVDRVPASGTSAVLTPGEIKQLIQFANHVHEKFPSLRDENGNAMPADVEFAFKDGRLHLLQIRPFVESGRAQSSSYLARLDAGLEQTGARPVPLNQPPGRP